MAWTMQSRWAHRPVGIRQVWGPPQHGPWTTLVIQYGHASRLWSDELCTSYWWAGMGCSAWVYERKPCSLSKAAHQELSTAGAAGAGAGAGFASVQCGPSTSSHHITTTSHQPPPMMMMLTTMQVLPEQLQATPAPSPHHVDPGTSAPAASAPGDVRAAVTSEAAAAAVTAKAARGGLGQAVGAAMGEPAAVGAGGGGGRGRVQLSTQLSGSSGPKSKLQQQVRGLYRLRMCHTACSLMQAGPAMAIGVCMRPSTRSVTALRL